MAVLFTQAALLVRLATRVLVRERVRLLVTVAIGAFGAVILLTGAAALPAATFQMHVREAWLPTKGSSLDSGILMQTRMEYYAGSPVLVHRVARKGVSGVSLPGVDDVPEPRTLITSPALGSLMDSSLILRERYPGRVVGTIANEALTGPRELVVVIGVPQSQLESEGAELVSRFERVGRTDLQVPSVVRAGAPFVVAAFMVPLVWLYALVSNMGSASRDVRLAALRLVGVRSSRLRLSVATEAFLASILGSLVGLLCFVALGPLLGPLVPIAAGVWPQDVTTPLWAVLVVCLAIPLVCALAAWAKARTAVTEPLATARRALRTSNPRAGYALFAGGCTAVAIARFWTGQSVDIPLFLLSVGFVSLAIGIIKVSGDISRRIGRTLASKAQSLAGLIAGRTIDHQQGDSAGVAVGLSLLVLLSGVLLGFLPLLSDASAGSARRLADGIGRDSIVVSVTEADAARVLRASSLVASVTEIHQPADDTNSSEVVVCDGLAMTLGGRTWRCSPGVPPVIARFLSANGMVLNGATYFQHSPPGIWNSGGSAHRLLVQPTVGTSVEEFRNLALIVDRGGSVLTMGEEALEKSRTSEPFRKATMGAMIGAILVGLASLIAALMNQALMRREAVFMLRVAGSSQAALRMSVVLQMTLTILPGVLLAFAGTMIVTPTFLHLNESAALGVPYLQIVVVAALACLAGPVAALTTSRYFGKLGLTYNGRE